MFSFLLDKRNRNWELHKIFCCHSCRVFFRFESAEEAYNFVAIHKMIPGFEDHFCVAYTKLPDGIEEQYTEKKKE